MKTQDNIWAIALLDGEVTGFNKVVRVSGLPIKVRIPRVKVIEKQFKNKTFFVEVPLLFNYGFVNMPISWARSKEKLKLIVDNIPILYGWLNKKLPKPKGVITLDDNEEEVYTPPPILVESVPFREILRLEKLAAIESIYSKKDLKNLKEGSYIVLKGYPFDDIPVQVLDINLKKSEVKVKLLSTISFMNEVTVHFHNIFYTIYSGYSNPLSQDRNSLDYLNNILTKSNINYEPTQI